jgi:hypothetical protein
VELYLHSLIHLHNLELIKHGGIFTFLHICGIYWCDEILHIGGYAGLGKGLVWKRQECRDKHILAERKRKEDYKMLIVGRNVMKYGRRIELSQELSFGKF